jgi:hypothetical protein
MDSVPNIPDSAQLAEVMAQADAGVRLAMPRYAELIGLGGDARAPLDRETIEEVAKHLAAARESLVAAMKELDVNRHRDGAAGMHLRVGQLALGVTDLGIELTARDAS